LKIRLGILLAALALLALVPVVQASTSGPASPSTGSVTYSLQLVANGTTRSASVTETVSPDSSPGMSIIQLAVQGTQSNFTYSHAVNSSLTLFPYLPSITNNNYTYTGKSGSVTAKIAQEGTSKVAFAGSSYTLTDYAFSATYSDANGTGSVTGTVSAFPSDLVYSASASSSQGQVTATLTSTSLSLSAASLSPAVQATSAGVGISLAIGAVAVSLGVRYRNKPQAQGPKPDHWVD